MSPSRVLAPGALIAALLYGDPAAAQDFIEPFDSAGGGLFVGYAFGSGGGTVTWGLEGFLSKEIDKQFCSSEPRTVYGPIARLSLHGLSRPALTLAAHAGREIQRAAFGLSAEAGLTLGYPEGLERDPVLSPHSGFAAEGIIFDVFARQEWLLDVYSVGGGVRIMPTFGSPAFCVVGRPQRDAQGRALHVRTRGAPVATLNEAQALAHDWGEQAREEFESVPAFLGLGSELASAGAPAQLVERALSAAIDELRHAGLCARVAGTYGRARALPLPRPVRRTPLPGRAGLERLATESFWDGCVGEGLSASLAEDGAEQARDPLIEATQSVIAKDERRHERLAWDIVRWCLAREPRVRRALGTVSSTPLEPPPTLSGDVERNRRLAHRHRKAAVERLNALF